MTTNAYGPLAARLESVRAALADAAASSGRNLADITLVAVSKRHPAQAVAALADLGHTDFGESYIQEALAKQDELVGRPLRWHFVGRLQSNKARFAPGRFHLVHGVDSISLARTLHKAVATRSDAPQAVLIQVNVGREPQKSGVSEEDLPALAEAIQALPGLALQGLMCLPPAAEDPELARHHFARLRELKEALETRLGVRLPHLSMGMSQDFRQAVEEGATLVRIGTALFGSRLDAPVD